MIPVSLSGRLGRGAAGGVAVARAGACADEPPAPPPTLQDEILSSVVVDDVASAEIGRTHRGFILSAIGSAQGDGWRGARLRPRLGAPDAEGFLDFDLIAVPPAQPGPDAEPEAVERAARAAGLTQRLRADTPLAPEQLFGAKAVRVFARQGSAAVTLQAPAKP